jgi:membrane associated rhomboid family serine protease
MEGPGTAVRVTPSRRRADEWAVVLAAADIPHWLRQRLDGWALIVPPDDAATALATLAAYDEENSREGVNVAGAGAPSPPMTIVGVVVALLLLGFFAITGPRAGGSAWFEHGSADATRMLGGEWWRAVTALTLHADAPHVLANAAASALLMTAVCWHLGPGVGLWLLLLAGAGGNALTAAVHGGDHVSVGASTAVFGAIGILAALQITRSRAGASGMKSWVVIAASLALLALLGTGPHADVLAHLFGFLVGGGLGLMAALTIRWSLPAPVQWLLVAAAGAAVVGAWRLAF